jgi:hypothetical protein
MSQAINNTKTEIEFNVGDYTTCQFGNPFDTDWTEATHADQSVMIIAKERCEITRKMFYLVKQDGKEFLARAYVPYTCEGAEPPKGALYSTNGRSYGTRGQQRTGRCDGIYNAAHSLGFDPESIVGVVDAVANPA